MDMVLEQNHTDLIEMLQKVELYIPKWVETLPADHPVKAGLIEKTMAIMKQEISMEQLKESGLKTVNDLEFVSKAVMDYQEAKETEKGIARIRIEVDDAWYYEMLSSLAGVKISGEYQLISMIRELSALKEEYEKAEQALLSVRSTGYGVITPDQKEIRMEEPVVIRHGNKFGVKLKASCPSIHLIKADIETEISPIVGNEQQAEDLIAYIKDSSQSKEGIWETNIFGKSIEQLTEDGIRTKLAQIGEESQQKLQNIMQRVVNETTGGFICIIL